MVPFDIKHPHKHKQSLSFFSASSSHIAFPSFPPFLPPSLPLQLHPSEEGLGRPHRRQERPWQQQGVSI